MVINCLLGLLVYNCLWIVVVLEIILMGGIIGFFDMFGIEYWCYDCFFCFFLCGDSLFEFDFE